jgi:hypothetical protein
MESSRRMIAGFDRIGQGDRGRARCLPADEPRMLIPFNLLSYLILIWTAASSLVNS